jgi:hypothetical protein
MDQSGTRRREENVLRGFGISVHNLLVMSELAAVFGFGGWQGMGGEAVYDTPAQEQHRTSGIEILF